MSLSLSLFLSRPGVNTSDARQITSFFPSVIRTQSLDCPQQCDMHGGYSDCAGGDRTVHSCILVLCVLLSTLRECEAMLRARKLNAAQMRWKLIVLISINRLTQLIRVVALRRSSDQILDIRPRRTQRSSVNDNSRPAQDCVNSPFLLTADRKVARQVKAEQAELT